MRSFTCLWFAGFWTAVLFNDVIVSSASSKCVISKIDNSASSEQDKGQVLCLDDNELASKNTASVTNSKGTKQLAWGSTSQDLGDSEFDRDGRDVGHKFMRFGRDVGHNFMRFGRPDPSYDEDSDVSDAYNDLESTDYEDESQDAADDKEDDTAFDRAAKDLKHQFMRFGRGNGHNFMRFGRGNGHNFMRFGRGDGHKFMRFGKSGHNFMRFGRGGHNFMRFGRSNGHNFMRFGRNGHNFMRFGRPDDSLNDDLSSDVSPMTPEPEFDDAANNISAETVLNAAPQISTSSEKVKRDGHIFMRFGRK